MSDYRLNVTVTMQPVYPGPPASDDERARRAEFEAVLSDAEKVYASQIEADFALRLQLLLEYLMREQQKET